MKRTALIRRTPMRPWVRPDPIPPELAQYVLDRDRICLQARVDPQHQCRTRFGDPHASDDRRYLRIAHVKVNARMGKRAEPLASNLVTECDLANETWSSSHRDIERSYLADVEP